MALLKLLAVLFLACLATGCATPKDYDYTAFRQHRPRSILVLPPLNNTPEVNAVNSVYAQISYPLAESGYYVFPVALVNETFRQNGLANPAEIHAVGRDKLHEIFGADAALYLTITRYGPSYTVFSSAVVVSLEARLLDLKTGTLLWDGAVTVADDAGNHSGNGLAGMLLSAALNHVMNNLVDNSHAVAGRASNFLLGAGRRNGMLYGPRRPEPPQ